MLTHIAWIVLVTAAAIAGILFLFLFLFRVRYQVEWNGGLNFSALLDYGVPGFRSTWKFPSESVQSEKTSTSSIPADVSDEKPDEKTFQKASSSRTSESSKSKSRFDRSRAQRALFLFMTDPSVLRGMLAYGLRCLRLTFKLLHLELNAAVSRSNPAQLGRLAGYWYATKPFLPTRRVNVEFHFEDPKSSLRLRARGGFSALQALTYLMIATASFPWFLVVKKAWRSWRNPRLFGWRMHVFGWIRKAQRA